MIYITPEGARVRQGLNLYWSKGRYVRAIFRWNYFGIYLYFRYRFYLKPHVIFEYHGESLETRRLRNLCDEVQHQEFVKNKAKFGLDPVFPKERTVHVDDLPWNQL